MASKGPELQQILGCQRKDGDGESEGWVHFIDSKCAEREVADAGKIQTCHFGSCLYRFSAGPRWMEKTNNSRRVPPLQVPS